MKLVFFTNYLNHHQVLVADEFYRLLGGNFRFVATLPVNEKELKGGANYSKRPYCILAAENDEARSMAFSLAQEADTCVFGACSQKYAVERAKHNPKGLSFEMGERWLKHGLLTIGSPVFRQWALNYIRYFRKANFYKLCCSSFTASDDLKLGAYVGRHYKWGYFTRVEKNFVETCSQDVSTKGKVHILWCARFLLLKHPELVVQLAARLKDDGYDFVIDMYGDEGNLAPHDKPFPRVQLEKLIANLDVKDCVNLKGNRSNDEILKAMREADIFLFTSDRLEGWGAVANESMANGCVLVASDKIGSTGYLIEDKVTGLKFKSCNIDSLYEQVKFLLDNPNEMKRISSNGKQHMDEFWNPENAAKSLLKLIDYLSGRMCLVLTEGPCSKAD